MLSDAVYIYTLYVTTVVVTVTCAMFDVLLAAYKLVPSVTVSPTLVSRTLTHRVINDC